MSTIASQITSLTIVYSTVYSDADQRKHQSSASLAFVWGIHRGPVNSPPKWPVMWKMFPFDDVIMENWPVRMVLHYNFVDCLTQLHFLRFIFMSFPVASLPLHVTMSKLCNHAYFHVLSFLSQYLKDWISQFLSIWELYRHMAVYSFFLSAKWNSIFLLEFNCLLFDIAFID